MLDALFINDEKYGLTSIPNRLLPSSLVLLFQNESKCKIFHMKMSFANSSISMQIKVIFTRMVSHLDLDHIRKQKCKRFKGKLVHVNATVSFTQTVKKATCLMTTTQYNSSKNTPVSHLSLNEASFEKRHNLDEHVNIVSKAEELSVTQISFKTQDPNIRHNPESVSKVTADPRSTVF